MITADKLQRTITIPHCVKLYAGSGNRDRIFIFPYRGRLSVSKIARMAVDLMEFYPDESMRACINSVRNLAERCAWTEIQPMLDRYDKDMVQLRGDGWMNMRESSAVIIFSTYTEVDDDA